MLYIAHWSNPMVVRIRHYSPLVSDMLQTVTGKDSDYNGMGRIHARLRQRKCFAWTEARPNLNLYLSRAGLDINFDFQKV